MNQYLSCPVDNKIVNYIMKNLALFTLLLVTTSSLAQSTETFDLATYIDSCRLEEKQ